MALYGHPGVLDVWGYPRGGFWAVRGCAETVVSAHRRYYVGLRRRGELRARPR
jgi:hypothetical protein